MRVFSILTIAFTLVLSACAYPATVTQQGASPAAIYFIGAPEASRVLVDDTDAGEAALFDGRRQVLAIEPGRHNIRVVSGGLDLYNDDLYVGAGARVEVRVP